MNRQFLARRLAFVLMAILAAVSTARAMTIDVVSTQATVYGDASYPVSSSTYSDTQSVLASGGKSFSIPAPDGRTVSSSGIANVAAGHLGAYARNDVAIGSGLVSATSEFFVSLNLSDVQPGEFLTVLFEVHGSGVAATSGSNVGSAFIDTGTGARSVNCSEAVCVGDTSPLYLNSSAVIHAKLDIQAASGGLMDFLNSADATLIAPPGAVIHDTTGLIHAVPAPPTAWLIATALGVLAPWVKRRAAA